jgi:hypothetical protein
MELRHQPEWRMKQKLYFAEPPYGPEFLGQLAKQQLGDSKDSRQDAVVLGVMLRRQLDGTWPVVTKLLKRVLADYDPGLAKEVGNKL